ncbi:MAG: SPOR domain-containing protein [Bacteroidetes bacterium]|nr:MAG: SPOR domain-containing protein [Bacteroidota bacterium]
MKKPALNNMARLPLILLCFFLLSAAKGQSSLSDEIIFRIQVKVSKQQQTISGLDDVTVIQTEQGSYTYFSGSFKTYKEADEYKSKLKSKGFSDAFVATFRGKTKISVADYQKIVSKNPEAPKEAAASADSVTKSDGTPVDSTIQRPDSVENNSFEKDESAVDVSANLVKKILEESSCPTLVKDAEALYNNGSYEECLALLDKGFKDCGFSRREKEDAWVLRAKVNIEKDKVPDVQQALVRLLRINPNYKPLEGAYQEDFYSYFSKIKVRPLLSTGIFAGPALPVFKTLKTYSVFDSVNYSSPYRSLPGNQEGIFFELAFMKNISITSAFSYTSYAYKRHLERGTVYFLDYKELLHYWTVPAYLKFFFTCKKINPYFIAGGSYSKLLKSTAELSLQYTSQDALTGIIDEFTSGASGIDQKPYRVNFYTSILFGAGCSYRIKNFLFSAETSYSLGRNNIMNPDAEIRNTDLIYKFYYIDNAVKIDLVTTKISVAYILHYQVKKTK